MGPKQAPITPGIDAGIRTNKPTRVKLAVYVDLDPVPGLFHSDESARNAINDMLQNAIPHYKPTVTIEYTDATADLIARAIDDWFATESSTDGLGAFLTRILTTGQRDT